MSKKQYWKGFDELHNTPEFLKNKKEEFLEELPLLDTLKDAGNTKTKRRDFLKILGYSLTAATVAASCEIPIRNAIPYVVKPEQIVPGIANYYASTFVNGSTAIPILVKTREGRPIKIEGNKACSMTKGGTSAQAQASVIDLYDNYRLKDPHIKGEKTTWSAFDKAVGQALSSARGETVLLTRSILSPSTKAIINRFPKLKVVNYEPVSYSGMLKANEQSFGQKVVPAYHFDKAEVVVGIDCNFLGTWISPVEFTADYVQKRKVDANNPVMSQHFQFEPRMSMTGAKADYRRSVKPSQLGAVLIELYRKVGGSVAASGVNFSEKIQSVIDKAAIALKGARGKAMVVCGINTIEAQTLTNAINSQIGAYASCIDLNKAYTGFQGDDAAMQQLVSDMNAGRVGALMLNNVNPAYDYVEADKFIAGIKKVGTSISFNDRTDETSEHVNYWAPDHHYLESWDDVEIKKGHYSLMQPTIAPLFRTRSMAESLMAWANIEGNYYDFIRNHWKSNLLAKSGASDFDAFWNKSLHDGIFESHHYGEAEESPMANAPFTGNATAAAAILSDIAKKASGVEVVLYENNTVGDGRYANNPFLQETPDPIAKIAWENYAIVSPKMAKDNNWTDGQMMHSPTRDSDVIKVSVNGQSLEIPITIQPGLPSDVIAIAVGYGRTKMGKAPGMDPCATGKNAYKLAAHNGQSVDFYATGASIEKVGGGYQLAQTQSHHTIDSGREIINETTLAKYKAKKDSGNYSGQKRNDPHHDKHFVSLYPGYDEQLKQGHHWGMAIDLNTCTGCAACVVACNVENNVPVVGREDVIRGHEMHWMRIDRYYSANPETDPDFEHPEVAFQPMMCQHCDNAPCENVCPVNASNHSSEGLNQMAYNRCIGTRYCANNCPYKVRRFNWFDYQGTDSFYARGILTNDEHVMVDNLTRMVLNPDVTIRSRGVMEKCSFCVQNLQSAKLEAKKEGRKLRDGEAITACQSACPTNAISFGDMNDKDSEVSKAKADKRSYQLLEDIHVLSSVSYMTMVRNKDEIEGNPDYDKRYKAKPHHKESHEMHDDHGHGGHGHGGHGDGHGKHDDHKGHGHDGHNHDDHSGHDH